jgi:YVTN family beta-propeller protein
MSHYVELSMRSIALYTTVGIALFVATAVHAASSDGRYRMLLYVDNSLGDDISVIDLDTLNVVDTIKVGNQPHGLCAPADGRRLFTTIEAEKNLKTIETTSGKIVDTVPVNGKPNECAATPDGRYVGVPIRDGDAVDIVDTTLKKS